MLDSGSDAIGVVLFILGAYIMLRLRKRRFDRTNVFGVQQFSSYWGSLVAKAKDWLLGGAAVFLLCTGTVLLAFNHVASWGWIVALPVCVIMIFMMIGN